MHSYLLFPAARSPQSCFRSSKERQAEADRARASSARTANNYQRQPCCPVHRIARPGRDGLYCPARKPNGDYCDWTHPMPEDAAGPAAPNNRPPSNGRTPVKH